MKKKLSLIFLSILTILLSSKSAVLAKTMSGENLMVAADEVIEDDLFIAGTNIEILGKVDGDIYAAGDKIVFAGETSGDLIAVGGTIDVSGQIADDVRVFAGNIEIHDAQIGSALTAAGGKVNVADSVEVMQSVMIAGGNNIFAGKTMRHLMLAGGSNQISGQVGKDLLVGGEGISLNQGASVSGNLIYGSDRELALGDRSRVAGKISRQELPVEWQRSQTWLKAHQDFRWPKMLTKSFGFFSFLLWALVLIVVWPKLFKNMAKKIEAEPAKNILIGLLAMFLVMPIFVFLLLTIIGIPLAFLFLLWTIFLSGFAKAFVAIWLGQKAFDQLQPKPKQKSLIWQFLLGYIMIFALSLVPLFGWLVKFLTMLLGTGAVYSRIIEKKKK